MPSENLFDLFRSRFPHDLDALFLEIPEGDCWSYRELEFEFARLPVNAVGKVQKNVLREQAANGAINP